MPFLLHQLLERAAAETPERTALWTPKRRATYAELAAETAKAEAALAALGVSRGEPVGLCLEKSVEAIAALFAILRRGACYVPIDPFAPKPRIAAILDRAGVRVVVAATDRAFGLADELAALPEPPRQMTAILTPTAVDAGGRALTFRGWIDEPADAPTPAPSVTEAHLAYILHTSGSTGVPKGVAISHRAAMSFVEMAAGFFAARPDDVFACHAPLTFDLSVFDLFVAMYVGATVVLLPDFFAAFPKKIAETIHAERVTVWNSVVSALSLLVHRVDLSRFDLTSLRLCVFSGEVMPMTVLRKVHTAFPNAELYNVYGQTEANSSLYYRVDDIPADDAARLPIGRPFPNFDPFALGEGGAIVQPGGEPGELYIRAPTVAAGYFRDPERTAEKFVEDPLQPGLGARVYRTGDRVRLDADGNFTFLGRADNLVKVRGYRVELSEVELALNAAPGVAEAVVLAIPDPEVGHRLVGFVQAVQDVAVDPAGLAAHVGATLPKYMVPEPIAVAAALPRTATGKIDKKALLASLDTAGPT